MKSYLNLIFSLSACTFLIHPANAEGKANKDWAELAAKKYEQKAEHASNPEVASIYLRMAQIKRDAGAASKRGEKFSWSEYEKLQSKLHSLNKTEKFKNKKKANYSFIDAATKYEQKALEAASNGNPADAAIYRQLATMKRNAAAGEKVNWDNYHKLSSQLSSHKKYKKTAHPKKKKHNPQHDFLEAAAKYQLKSSEAMAAGNVHNAKIYTKLANIKKEAAKAIANGQGYDWSEYFALQKQLK